MLLHAGILARHPEGRPPRNSVIRPHREVARAARVLACCFIGLLGAGGRARDAWPGTITWGPGVDLAARSENPATYGDPANGWIAGVAPHLTIERAGVASNLQLDGRRTYESIAPGVPWRVS